MRQYSISGLFAMCAVAVALALCAASTTASAQSATDSTAATRYEKHRSNYESRWSKLIPNQFTLQYAGSIGAVSAGAGWHYGKNLHWETDLLVGFLPKYHSRSAHATFTVKERYVPWHCQLNERFTVEPLTAGAFFSTISGEDFWRNQPSRYPKRYYGLPTKLRTNIFVGQRLRFHIPSHKRVLHQSVSVYYEISTCDIYLLSKATNKSYPWSKTLSLAIGVKWDL